MGNDTNPPPPDTCYMCHRVATTREHVPPRAFFPKAKDVPEGVDFRRDLNTVPSCSQHNLAKSRDDEYLAIAIASSIQGNEVAYKYMSRKTLRAIGRRPSLVGVFRDLFPIQVQGRQTGGFFVDRARFDRALDHISRGSFFLEYREKLLGPVNIHTSSLFDTSGPDAPRANALNRALTQFASRYLASRPRKGQLPQVFYYQIIRDEKSRAFIRMVFYGGFVVDAYSPDILGSPSDDA